MYYDLLIAGNKEFTQGVSRTIGHKSKRLQSVITYLNAVQATKNAKTVSDLLKAINQWRNLDPREFATRGGTNGIVYRLWMEARQALENNFHAVCTYANPMAPNLGPGVTLLGVYVPEGEGHIEICHGFAYRWAIAAGKMAEAPDLPARRNGRAPFNADTAAPVLYPNGFASLPSARVNGVTQLLPGDIISMWVTPVAPPEVAANDLPPPQLGHSLIARTATVWYSANNAGTFGVGTGRSEINTANNFGMFAGHQVGWVGDGSQWMRPDGVALDVVYLRLP